MLTENRRKDPAGTDADHRPPDTVASRRQRITNWVLALLTIVGAAAAVLFAYGTALGTSGCNDRACPQPWPRECACSGRSSTAHP